MYHGIIIDQEFTGKSFLNKFRIFAKKKDGNWGIYGIEVEDSKLVEVISYIQQNMNNDQPWYAHLYNEDKLIVIFKDRIFYITSDISSWAEVLEYGRELNIPEDQLDFQPNKFEDESSYFKPDSL